MRICDVGGRNRLVKNLICVAVVGRRYSMQQFLNNWSVLCTATEAHFGKGRQVWWCGARDYCSFAMGVRVAVFGATIPQSCDIKV